LSGLNLADAIEQLRTELEIARCRALDADVRFPINGVTVELCVVATAEGEGRAGFKVPVIDLELGAQAGYSREATHKVTIEFGTPVDANGDPLRVSELSAIPLD
jgi:hypothetical protein